MRKSAVAEKARQTRILERLEALFPDAKTELEYRNPFELLIAVILSAQCTDKQVNKVTPGLFEKFPSPEAFAVLSSEELEPHIRSIGLFKSKARHIVAACRMLVEAHGSQVPARHEDLVKLPGVGRKTANVVVSTAFDTPAIAVDTHVFRVSNRLRLATGKTPEQVEQGLMKLIPPQKWGKAHHWLILHGRYTCTARAPQCQHCGLAEWCPSAGNGV